MRALGLSFSGLTCVVALIVLTPGPANSQPSAPVLAQTSAGAIGRSVVDTGGIGMAIVRTIPTIDRMPTTVRIIIDPTTTDTLTPIDLTTVLALASGSGSNARRVSRKAILIK